MNATGTTLLAHIIGYSAGQLRLRPGVEVWAILKTLTIDPPTVAARGDSGPKLG